MRRADPGAELWRAQGHLGTAQHRLQRALLGQHIHHAAAAAERRITYGCVVVPVAFYQDVIAPTLGRRRGVVYVLPEQGTLEAMLRGAEVALRAP